MSNSLWPHGLKLSRSLCPWNSPGKNTGVGGHALLQRTFLTQEMNPVLTSFRKKLNLQVNNINLKIKGNGLGKKEPGMFPLVNI